MKHLRRIFVKFYLLFANSKVEAELAREIGAHLVLLEDEYLRQGMTPEDARRTARLAYGGVEQTKQLHRDERSFQGLSQILQDTRFAFRQLRKSPVFAATVILMLGLGIGANIAIYSFMESILLRSLPVPDPESLAVLNWHSRPPQEGNKESVHVMHGVQGMAWPGDKGVMVSGMFPYGAFETLREENPVFSTLFGYFNGLNRNLSIHGQATTASTEYVTGEDFRGLAGSPAPGRLMHPEDDRPSAAPVAVIRFATSQNRFGGPPNAIGQSILVDNIPFTVIGVAPPEFFGVDPAVAPDQIGRASCRERV